MQKNKKVYMLMLLMAISFVLLISEVTFGAASAVQDFSDVSENDWFFTDVEYVCSKGLMNGTSEMFFSPNESTTRGMIVTILWRLDGKTADEEGKRFSDVLKDKYYYDAVSWASANSIVNGYDNSSFGPEDPISREQLAVILYRYAAYKNISTADGKDISGFGDFEEIGEYAVEAMKWANANGIINGITSDKINPKGNATRCQAAAILKRLCENIIKTDEKDRTEELPNTETNTSDKTSKPSGGAGNTLNEATRDEEDEHPANTDEEIISEQTVIKINNASGEKGDTIEIAAELKENPGILGMILLVYFDDSVLLLENVEKGAALDTLDMTTSKNLGNGACVIFDGVEIKAEDIKDGTFLLMKFKIKDDAQTGKYPITLKYTDGDILDNNLSMIKPSVEDGYIEVYEGSETI